MSSELSQGGRKRTCDPLDEATSRSRSSSLSPPPHTSSQSVLKKSKKAVTKPCPVCGDRIPVRLLGAHADLEMNRVQEILRNTGPSAISVDLEEGPSACRRGAALRARHAINPRGGRKWSTVEQIDKTVKLLQRNRKTRNLRLKEIIAQDDEDDQERARHAREASINSATCPVCLATVRGDPDVIDAHVDSCIANVARLQLEAEERERFEQESQMTQDPWNEIEVDGEIRLHLNSGHDLRGTGIRIHNRTQADIEEDVDVDGDDEFGTAQFTEVDVVDPSSNPPNSARGEGEHEDDDGGITLRDLVAEGKVAMRKALSPDLDGVRAEVEQVMGVADTDRINQAISAARRSRNITKLVAALEDKIRQLEAMRVSSATSLLCRICLDPYNEPTVSTGCWHTFCRECWLRCLGSTRLCPICKRITAATDLRRVYM